MERMMKLVYNIEHPKCAIVKAQLRTFARTLCEMRFGIDETRND